jgi:hypothetical protein
MVAQVVEALCYKPEGRGFSTQWCQWNFSLTKFPCPHYGPQVNSASNRIEFQEYFLEDKGCWCWRPYHLHVLIVLKFGVLGLLEPSGPVQGLLYLLLLSTSVVLHESIVEEFLLWSTVLDLHGQLCMVLSSSWSCYHSWSYTVSTCMCPCYHQGHLLCMCFVYVCVVVVCVHYDKSLKNYRIWLPENGYLKRLCVYMYCLRNREIQVS